MLTVIVLTNSLSQARINKIIDISPEHIPSNSSSNLNDEQESNEN